jgi:hypothetical protein
MENNRDLFSQLFPQEASRKGHDVVPKYSSAGSKSSRLSGREIFGVGKVVAFATQLDFR